MKKPFLIKLVNQNLKDWQFELRELDSMNRRSIIVKLCACGCGRQTTFNRRKHKLNIRINGHNKWNAGMHGLYPCKDEVKEKIRISNLGKNLGKTHICPESAKKAISEKNTGRKNTPATCELISKKLKGKKIWCEGLTKETSPGLKRISEKAIIWLCEHHGSFKNTKPELLIKAELTSYNINFTHQYYIKCAKHVADFFIEPNIVIECDGDYWHNRPGAKERDAELTQQMTESGYEVYRFWEHEILHDAKECIENILLTADKFNGARI